VSRFIRDLDESFSDSKKRSLLGLRILALLAMVAAAGGAAAAIISLQEDPIAPIAAAGAVIGFGFFAHIMLWIAERRMHREQLRLQNLWMARRAEIQELTGRDELTQLQNRRFFYEQMEQEMELTDRYKRELSILMLDVDDLKLINDEFGHQIGDVVLRNFGRVLNAEAGERNITARIGGDEFAVIMPNASRKDADKLSWKIRGAVEGADLARPRTRASSSAFRLAQVGIRGVATRSKRSSTGRTRNCTRTSWNARASSTSERTRMTTSASWARWWTFFRQRSTFGTR
jgi:diguanylate cyclase (GGDEF)-like protein